MLAKTRVGAVLLSIASCANTKAPPTQQAKHELAGRVMELCGASGTLRQLATVQALSVEGLDTLPQHMWQDFLLLLCIESRFDPAAKSAVGAVGLAQVMPKYLKEFAEECGIKLASGTSKELDLVLVGACRFRLLHQRYGGNVALVLAAYNAGENSATIKRMQRLERINAETSDYLARYTYLKCELSRQLQASGSGEALPPGSQIPGQ